MVLGAKSVPLDTLLKFVDSVRTFGVRPDIKLLGTLHHVWWHYCAEKYNGAMQSNEQLKNQIRLWRDTNGHVFRKHLVLKRHW